MFRNTMTLATTEIFSPRAERYAQHRPGYPGALFRQLTTLRPAPAVAADIGAGTGLFSKGLCAAGYEAIAVEPNDAMRSQAAATLKDFSARVHEGRGEATGLPDASVDLVCVAQAFHWLDRARAHAEFHRITRPGGLTVIAWNRRVFTANPFMQDYQRLLFNCAPRYQAMKDQWWGNLERDVSGFFAGRVRPYRYPHTQRVGYDAMLGNLLSASYVPDEAEAGHEIFLAAAGHLFEKHQIGGRVPFELETILYAGALP